MIKRLSSQSYIFAMVAAVIIGLFVPQTKILGSYSTIFLQIIFFVSCLRIDFKSLLVYFKDWKFLVMANFLMLVGFPLVVWLVGLLWPSELGFAIYLLAAMPIGMTAPLLVELAGGRASMTMVLTVTTSLLAPFTIPLLTKLLFHATVAVDTLDIFKQLALVIFVPFLVAAAVRYFWPKLVEPVTRHSKPVSIILLGMLIAGAVAKQTSTATSISFGVLDLVVILIALYAFFFTMNALGYFSFWWEDHETKQTVSVSLACMNFTLAIFLASKFFPRPGIVLPLIIAIVPWVTVMPVWLKLTQKFK